MFKHTLHEKYTSMEMLIEIPLYFLNLSVAKLSSHTKHPVLNRFLILSAQ